MLLVGVLVITYYYLRVSCPLYLPLPLCVSVDIHPFYYHECVPMSSISAEFQKNDGALVIKLSGRLYSKIITTKVGTGSDIKADVQGIPAISLRIATELHIHTNPNPVDIGALVGLVLTTPAFIYLSIRISLFRNPSIDGQLMFRPARCGYMHMCIETHEA
jgi:hypothetical protein